MPREPIQKRSKAKKRKLIVSGVKLFSEKGYHQTGINEIADSAEVSVGLFYSYFKNKKDLLEQVATTYAHSICKGIYLNLAHEAPYHKGNKAIVEYLVNAAKEAHSLSAELHREILALKNREKHMQEIDNEIISTFKNEVEIILERIIDQLRIKDLKTAAEIITGAIEETMHRCFLEKDYNLERNYKELVDMCSAYLFKENGNQAPI